MAAQSLALLGLVFLATASAPVRLPVTLLKANPVTTITVGDQAVQAIVDTGGGELMLSREVIDAAGGVKLPDLQVSTDASGNRHLHSRFRIPVIHIGDRILREAVVIEAPAREAGDGPVVPNSIGRHFLSQYLVVVDYAGGAVTLWPPELGNADRAQCGDTRIPMAPTEEEHLAVSVFETAAGPLRLAWDTGATYSMLPVAMADELRSETFARGDTRFYSSKKLVAEGRNFGPLEFVLLPLQPPKDFQGMLGANFFAKHVVCFDPARREIRVR